jgi:hypothetical protein
LLALAVPIGNYTFSLLYKRDCDVFGFWPRALKLDELAAKNVSEFAS